MQFVSSGLILLNAALCSLFVTPCNAQNPPSVVQPAFSVSRLGYPPDSGGLAVDTVVTSSSFTVSHLEKTPAGSQLTRKVKPASLSPAPSITPVDTSVLYRLVDSLAIDWAMESTRKATRKAYGNRADRTAVQLKNVPAIFPFYIPTASARRGLVRARMSSGFGMRQHPVRGVQLTHAGIDLPASMGTLVYATADGVCRSVVNQPEGIGVAIYIDHGYAYQSLYGHLLSVWVRPGDVIRRGQIIGRVGQSGLTTGPHLHYSIRLNGKAVDPLPYCFLLANQRI